MIVFQTLPYEQLYLNNTNRLYFDPKDIESSELFERHLSKLSKNKDKLLIMCSAELSSISIPHNIVIDYAMYYGVNLLMVHTIKEAEHLVELGFSKNRFIYVPIDGSELGEAMLYGFTYVGILPNNLAPLAEGIFCKCKRIVLNIDVEDLEFYKKDTWAVILKSNILNHKNRWENLDVYKYKNYKKENYK